jgi:hypothetical protein
LRGPAGLPEVQAAQAMEGKGAIPVANAPDAVLAEKGLLSARLSIQR